MRHFMIAALMAVFVLFMPACATLDKAADDPRAQALLRATVQYAVLQAVDTNADRAERIVDIASQAIEYAQSDEITTAGRLEQAVRDHIDVASLSPETQIVAETLIQVVRYEVDQAIGDRQLDGETVVQVVTLLTWVRDAAQQAAIRASG